MILIPPTSRLPLTLFVLDSSGSASAFRHIMEAEVADALSYSRRHPEQQVGFVAYGGHQHQWAPPLWVRPQTVITAFEVVHRYMFSGPGPGTGETDALVHTLLDQAQASDRSVSLVFMSDLGMVENELPSAESLFRLKSKGGRCGAVDLLGLGRDSCRQRTRDLPIEWYAPRQYGATLMAQDLNRDLDDSLPYTSSRNSDERRARLRF